MGTTDNQPLELHVNGQRALRLEPNANGPNVIGGAANNSVAAGSYGAAIGGGVNNQAGANFAIVGGGYDNTAGAVASSNGQYTVTGTIGQPDAGAAMTGGNYSVTGGFWSLISVVQTAGLPNLTVTHSGKSVIISWPDTVSCILQQNNNLAASAGWTTSGYTISTNSGTNSITITAPAGNLFFRLANP